MHNILSRNQLDEWRHFEDTVDSLALEDDRLSDYYECLIECDTYNQASMQTHMQRGSYVTKR